MNSKLKITILYDNYLYNQDLTSDWGFACLLEFGKAKILFDTGEHSHILLDNIEKLGIDPKEVTHIFLSHFHSDHTGGLEGFLNVNPNVIVYYPSSFPSRIIELINKNAASSDAVSIFKEIQPNAYTLGEFEGAIPEQALAIRTAKSIVLITGCAHPGINKIIDKAKLIFGNEPIHLVIGGFHLYKHNSSEMNIVLENLIHSGIELFAPSHCTGEKALKNIEQAFAEQYVKIGVGKTIEI